MNQRIKELMLKSNPDGDFSDCEWVFERFAELIVQECCNAIRLDDAFNGGKFMRIIKNHFGVDK